MPIFKLADLVQHGEIQEKQHSGQLTCILRVIPGLIFHFRLRLVPVGTHVFWGKFEGSSSGRLVDQLVSWVKLGNLELNLSIDSPRWEGAQHSILTMVPQHSGREANGSSMQFLERKDY